MLVCFTLIWFRSVYFMFYFVSFRLVFLLSYVTLFVCSLVCLLVCVFLRLFVVDCCEFVNYFDGWLVGPLVT